LTKNVEPEVGVGTVTVSFDADTTFHIGAGEVGSLRRVTTVLLLVEDHGLAGVEARFHIPSTSLPDDPDAASEAGLDPTLTEETVGVGDRVGEHVGAARRGSARRTATSPSTKYDRDDPT